MAKIIVCSFSFVSFLFPAVCKAWPIAGKLALVQVFRLFTHWRKLALQLFQENGTIDVVVRWGSESEAKTLIQRMQQEVRVEEPEDIIMPADDYQRMHGDWRSNGKGHRFVQMGNVSGILIPGPKLFRVKRARVMVAEVRTETDQGNFQLGPNQLEEAMGELAANFMPARATGQALTLGDLLGTGVGAAALQVPTAHDASGSAALASAPSGGAASSSGGSNVFSGFGFGMTFGCGGGGSETTSAPAAPRRGGSAPAAATARVAATARPQAGQAACSAEGAGGASRGRPREDVLKRAQKIVTDFEASGRENARFFGSERKTQQKAMVRALDDLAKEMDQVSDDGRLMSMQVVKKQVEIVLSVCRSYWKQSGFAQAFAEAAQFARMYPPLPSLPFPQWMSMDKHKIEASMAKVDEFWSFLSPAALRPVLGLETTLEDAQRDMTADRIVELVRREGVQGLPQALCALVAPEKYADQGICDVLAAELSSVYRVACFKTLENEQGELKTSIAAVQDTERKIAHAICAFPSGRALVAAAAEHADKLLLQDAKTATIEAIVKSFTVPAPDATSADFNWDDFSAQFRAVDAKFVAEEIGGNVELMDRALVLPSPSAHRCNLLELFVNLQRCLLFSFERQRPV